jgi:8-oxo-dGTP pyrophosphatase MutT (NUDIX family)
MNCTNCQEKNHTFGECRMPVESHGVLGYKLIKGEYHFLLVRRKDTMGYIDFLRGKYRDTTSIKTLIEEMTTYEQEKIKTLDFEELWDGLWVNHFSRPYVNEKRSAKASFDRLDKNALFGECGSRYTFPEYCIPKGRKNVNERPYDCGIREFIEETGLDRRDFEILQDSPGLVERFYASNGINYSHHYLLAEITSDEVPVLDDCNQLMMGEIGEIKYFTFQESINIFRKYDTGKRGVIYTARNYLNSLALN